MKNKILKIFGLTILITGLFLGLLSKEAFSDSPPVAQITDWSVEPNCDGCAGKTKVTLFWPQLSGNVEGIQVWRMDAPGYNWKERVFTGASATSAVFIVEPGRKHYFIVVPYHSCNYNHAHMNCAIHVSYSATLEINLGTGYKIGGSALDQNDQPQAGVIVSIYDESGANLIAETTTDGLGKYYCESVLDPGKYTLKATKDKGQASEKIIEPNVDVPNPVTVTDKDVTNVNFRFCLNCAKIVFVHGAEGSPGDWTECKCASSKNFEIYKYQWSGKAGEKRLQDFGDNLNAYIKEKKIDDGQPFIVVAHSFGALIARAGIIRAQENSLVNANNEHMYEDVHFVQVAPMIDGNYWAGKAPSWWPSLQTQNMDPTGEIQKWLYDLGGRTMLAQQIGPGGKVDIIMATRDGTAAPRRSQLYLPYLGAGIREDSEGAPILLDNLSWQEPHAEVLNSNVVCSVAKGPDATCNWPQVPVPKPHLVLKSDRFITEGNGGKIEVTLYNVGSDAENVQVEITSNDTRIKITKATANLGKIKTGEEATNTADQFVIELPQGAPKWFFAPLYNFKITSSDGSVFNYSDRITISKVKVLWTSTFPTLSSLFRSLNFAKRILNYIATLGGSESVAEDTAPRAQKLESQPVLADLNKDGSLEAIVPIGVRQLRVLKSAGGEFWPVPYSISDPGCLALYPVAADINNDGELEIVLSEYGADIVRILDKNGNLLRFVSGVSAGMPAVADIDNSGDGKMEIVVAKGAAISAIDSEGRILWQKTGIAEYVPATSAPVLFDLNSDGKKEIITQDICALDKNGNVLWNKPSSAAGGCAVADLNNDGKAEIISASGKIYTSTGDQWIKLYDYQPEYPPVVADLDGDGELEVLTIRETGDVQVYYDITETSSKSAQFTYAPTALQRYPTAIYDMEQDAKPEIVLAANTDSVGMLHFLTFTDGQLQLFDTYVTGEVIDWNTGFKITHTPLIADINNDGVAELIIGDLASEYGNRLNYLGVGSAAKGAIFWLQFQRDTLRSGLYDTQPPQLNPIGDKTVDMGKTLSFTVTASNTLVGRLSFSAYPLPQGAKLINNGNGSATFTWTPSYSQAGVYPMAFTVNDGALSRTEAISVTVVSDTTPPTTPVMSDAGISTLSTASLFASWSSSDPETGIAEYQYCIIQDSPTGPVIKSWTSAGKNTSVTASGLALTRGKTYYFGVKAKNNIGLWSTVGYSDGIIAGILSPPANFSANPGRAGEINLSWQNSSPETYGYSLEYSLNGVNFSRYTTLTQSVTTLTAPGLTPGARYYFRIRAYKDVLTYSAYSNVASAIVKGLNAPSNLVAATAQAGEVKLTWQENNPGDTVSVSIERSTNGVNFTVVATATSNNTYTVTGLAPGTRQYFRVRSYKVLVGYSGYSNTANAVPAALAAPTNLTAAGGSAGEIKLSWQDNSPDEIYFQIEYGFDGVNFSYFTYSYNSNYTAVNLTPGKKYYFRVRALKSAVVVSAYSNVVNLVPPALAAPNNLTATPGGSFEVRLSWQDNSPDETSFVIERSTNGVNFTQIGAVTGNTTTYTTTATTPGIKNYFRVRGNKNNLIYSGYSNVAYAVPKALAAPTNLSVQGIGYGQAKLIWQDNSTDEDGFWIESSKDGVYFGGFPVGADSNTKTFVTGVGTFYFRVRAYKGSFGKYRYSGYSNTVKIYIRW